MGFNAQRCSTMLKGHPWDDDLDPRGDRRASEGGDWNQSIPDRLRRRHWGGLYGENTWISPWIPWIQTAKSVRSVVKWWMVSSNKCQMWKIIIKTVGFWSALSWDMETMGIETTWEYDLGAHQGIVVFQFMGDSHSDWHHWFQDIHRRIVRRWEILPGKWSTAARTQRNQWFHLAFFQMKPVEFFGIFPGGGWAEEAGSIPESQTDSAPAGRLVRMGEARNPKNQITSWPLEGWNWLEYVGYTGGAKNGWSRLDLQLELSPRPYWLLGTRWDPYDSKTESTWRFLWYPTIGVSSEAGSNLEPIRNRNQYMIPFWVTREIGSRVVLRALAMCYKVETWWTVGVIFLVWNWEQKRGGNNIHNVVW